MSGQKEFWQSEAEKAGGPMLVAVLEDMRAKIDELVDGSARRDQAIEKLLSAFPGGDAEAHRRYHQAYIERMELRNRLIREALVAMAKAGAVGGVGWLLYAIWQAFLSQVHK